MPKPESFERLDHYLSLRSGGAKSNEYLGSGTDGDVWKTADDTAVKVFHYERGYLNERDSYQRLADFGVTNQIAGFWVPQMQGWNDRLMVIEMDVMHTPPYVIDFAKVRLNSPPEFSEEVLRDHEEQGRERFEHNWRAVKRLLAELESYQIYYLDPQRGNITFPDMP
jgi:hypothetical protein